MHWDNRLDSLPSVRLMAVCPAHAQDEGLQQFQQYLCKLVAERAREHYNTLVEGGEHMTQMQPMSAMWSSVIGNATSLLASTCCVTFQDPTAARTTLWRQPHRCFRMLRCQLRRMRAF